MTHSQQTKQRTQKRKRKKTTKTKLIFLYSIFLITVIPVIIVYLEHANVEIDAYSDTKSETKKIKTLSEGILFYSIGFGYIFGTIFMIIFSNSRIPYLIILVGTVAIVVLYYMRIYGVPIPFTPIVIVDFSSDWRDVITKIAQQILVIPCSMLLIYHRQQERNPNP